MYKTLFYAILSELYQIKFINYNLKHKRAQRGCQVYHDISAGPADFYSLHFSLL